MKLVEITWLDHNEAEGSVWMSRADAAAKPLSTCVSLGYLVAEHDDRYVLTSSHVEGEDTVARPFVVARCAVVKVRTLR